MFAACRLFVPVRPAESRPAHECRVALRRWTRLRKRAEAARLRALVDPSPASEEAEFSAWDAAHRAESRLCEAIAAAAPATVSPADPVAIATRGALLVLKRGDGLPGDEPQSPELVVVPLGFVRRV